MKEDNLPFFWPKTEIIYQKPKKVEKPKKDNCDLCGLFYGCQSPKMHYNGEGKKKILFVAEANGAQEDLQNNQLVGEAGQLLRMHLRKLKFELDEDGWKDNALACRPENNRTPTAREIALCRPRLMENIKLLKPEKIILLGKVAVQAVLGDRISITSIGKWVGQQIPDQDLQCWIFPTYHPSFLLRDRDNLVLEKLFYSHLKDAINWDHPFAIEYYEVGTRRYYEWPNEDLQYRLNKILETKPTIAFDYETTGIKPHANGHEILCISIADYDTEQSIVFPIFKDENFLELIKKILTDPEINKVAHNAKFEDCWTRFILGYRVQGWHWDTMLAAHVLDNREGICGLKFQTYINYGVIGYDSFIKPYIVSKSKNCNHFNRLKEVPLKDLLLYCAIDSKYTMKLYKRQKELMSVRLNKGYQLLFEGMLEFCDTEAIGIRVDDEYLIKQDKHLKKRLDRLTRKIEASKEVELWDKNRDKKFNINSSKMLQDLFINLLDYDLSKKTLKGNDSTDKEVLASLDTDFTRLILDYKKLFKIRGTYLAGFIRENIDGIMRPNFNLHTTRTFRSSSNAVNFQNIPRRDIEAQRICRRSIIPRLGRFLLEVDYSGLEVHIAACYNKDPVLIEYLEDETTDMHRDEAMNLFLLEEDQVTKEIRFVAKNSFVFAEFYGSYFVECAKNLWRDIDSLKLENGIPLKEHLKSNHISNYSTFEAHVANVEDMLWNEKYIVYRDWKKKIWADYQKTGNIKTLTGFRCGGLMKKNDVFSYPIQGSSFHCLLWSFIQLNQIAKKESWKSYLIGQIHDSIIVDVVPDEFEHIKKTVKRVMCEDVRNHWNWIIVPLSVSAEVTKTDGNWYDKEKIEI